MFYLRITKDLPFGDAFPRDVAREMFGLDICLYLPPSGKRVPQWFLGRGPVGGPGDIADRHGVMTFSLEMLIQALCMAEKRFSVEWWEQKFPDRRADPDVVVLVLIGEEYCELEET